MEKIRNLIEWFKTLDRRGKFAVLALVGLALVLLIEIVS